MFIIEIITKFKENPVAGKTYHLDTINEVWARVQPPSYQLDKHLCKGENVHWGALAIMRTEEGCREQGDQVAE